MTVTWLHISDFHFKTGDAYERSVVLNALVRSIEVEGAQDWQPDIVLATGDVAHSGQPAEYVHASEFFDKLLAAAKLNRSRLLVISGNHDVSRAAAKGLQRSLTSEDESVEFFGPDHPQHHFAKLKAFREWHDRYFASVRQLRLRTSCDTLTTVDIRGTRVTVAGINSALFSADDHDHGQLWIGRRCLDAAVEEVEREDGDLTIALIHHPLEWLHDVERTHIRAKLHHTVDFVLRGHLHESEIEAVTIAGGGALHLAAGASYQTRRYPNLALLVRADVDRGEVIVRPLRYGDKTEHWTLDTDLFQTADYHGRFQVAWKAASRRPPAGSASKPRTQAATTLFLLGAAGIAADSPIAVVACLIVDDKNELDRRLEAMRLVLLQDPLYRRADEVRAVLSAGTLPFSSGDPSVRARLLSVLSELTFEAYICYAEKTALAGKSSDEVLEALVGRLLFERVQARRRAMIDIALDSSLARQEDVVRERVATIVEKLMKGNASESMTQPTIGDIATSDPRLGIADYVSWTVERRLAAPGATDARGFDAIHPKVRVMHDYGTNVFYTRNNPFRG